MNKPISAKEMMDILSKSERTVRTIRMKIRAINGYPKNSQITIADFSKYIGIPEAVIVSHLEKYI